ncbi:MAG: TonB-dependent siderophore receptor [Caulobacteraceae bacterium]|nr:TonB-dependent siderophore receptor [Caulobacteraceae bacterium]
MRLSNSGVRARTKRALGAAAVAGVAGLTLAPAVAQADDAAATDVTGVDVYAIPNPEPESPKFVAPLTDTPRSVTVIPQKVIEQTAATSLEDLLRTSPGITFGAGEGGQPLADRPFIRGQASANNVFVDGVRDTGGQIREVFNLEQVEVIKGPDSVYSGRGSGGGSINLSSKRPKLDTFVNGSAAVGTDDYLRGTIDANWMLSDVSAVRLNLLGSRADYPGREEAFSKKYGVALAAAYGLGTPTRMTGMFYHLRTDGMPDYGVPLYTKLPDVPRTASGVLDVDHGAFYGLKARDYIETKADIATLAVEHDITDDITFRNVFRFARTLNDYVVTNPGDGGAAQFVAGEWWMKRGLKSRWNPTRTVANVTDIYGKFTTGALVHNFDVGLELSRERNRNASYTVTTLSGAPCPTGFTNPGAGDCTRVYAPNPDDPWTGTIERGGVTQNLTKTVGVYAFDSIELTPQLLLNLGIRYDDYSVSGRAPTLVITDGEWDFVNYQAGLVYKPTPETSLYVSYGTSSTPPTIAGGDQNGSPSGSGGGSDGTLPASVLDPEETESYEVGAKWQTFGGKLSLTAAVFRMERKNAQIQIDAGVYAQAGEARVQGLELGFSGEVTDRWSVFGGYAYTDSKLTKGAYNNVNVGDQLANTPKHNFSLFTTYQILDPLQIGGGAYYVSRSFGGNQGGAGGGTRQVYAPSYWRFDLFAAYQINERVDLQLNIKNIGDENYIVRTNGVHHADYGPGRQAIVTLNVRF